MPTPTPSASIDRRISRRTPRPLAGPVLIIDDDEAVRLALAAFIRCAGYQPVAVENGAAALELLAQLAVLPAVIILDLMMPEMDGASFRERQLADPRVAAIPVVIVSVLAGVADTSHLAAVACLPKAFDPDDLLAVIERHALRRESGASVPAERIDREGARGEAAAVRL